MPIGIELSSLVCRIVELERLPAWSRARGGDTRVASCRSLARGGAPPGVEAPGMALARLRGRQASVVLWGLEADHRVVTVRTGAYERMRLEARARVREAGISIDRVLSDIAPAGPRASAADRCNVVIASVPGAEVAAALAPVTVAGINVRAVLTPAAGLQSLARLRAGAVSGASAPDELEAWIALEETASCIVLIHEGALVAAHDVPWGFLDELAEFRESRERHAIAVRLADEIRSFLASCDVHGCHLSQVFICGAMPELRSMAVQLMDDLDVEVEPLDSLFGIDQGRLPEPTEAFHDRAAGLRLAWAAAANARPALDLFRARRRRATKVSLSRAAVFAGAVAGMSVGWSIAGEWPAAAAPQMASADERPVRPTLQRAVPPAPSSTAGVHASQAPEPLARRPIAASAGMLVTTMTPAPVLVATAESTPVLAQAAPASEPAAPLRAPAAAARQRPWENVPPLPTEPRAVAMNGPRAESVDRARQTSPSPSALASVVAPAPPAMSAIAASAVHAVPAPRVTPRAEAPQENALPFDASLETILFSSDRSLAIVNGRIVQVGDEVRGARIVNITASTVLLRDVDGKLRRLSLGER